MIDRIADYVRLTGTASEYLNFAEEIWSHPEQIYSDVNLAVYERLLRVEAAGADAVRIRRLAVALLQGKIRWHGWEYCAAVAPLMILRFGDRRSLPALRSCVKRLGDSVGCPLLRSSAIVLASFGRSEFFQMRRVASKMLRGELSDVVRMCEHVMGYESVPKRFRVRLDPIWDAVRRAHYFDMRRILSARLLLLNPTPSVRQWVKSRSESAVSRDTVSEFDRRLLIRLLAV